MVQSVETSAQARNVHMPDLARVLRRGGPSPQSSARKAASSLEPALQRSHKQTQLCERNARRLQHFSKFAHAFDDSRVACTVASVHTLRPVVW